MKKRNIIFRKRMYPVIFVMIIAVIIIALYLCSDIRFIVENTWSQNCLSAELEKVNFSKNILKSVPVLDIKKGKTDIVYNNTLCLVNNKHPIGEKLPFILVDYKDTGVLMDESIVESYAELSADVKKYAGDNLFVMSHYRNGQEQKYLYEEDNNTAALPGASEHQTGLALDVYVNGYAGSGFLKSDAGQYVNKNSWKYGFIIRYPLFKKHITGIRFEPWHIRFVGLPHSEIIYKEGLTLEEYISSFEIGSYYNFKNYYISRQEGDNLLIPYNLKEIMVSPDNTGCYIITGMIV
ncbi:MAG: M15 family metallopeptidase [Syntrophaceticus sp.]|jgi:D-alanyl-D-alanine carboxypeptidase|nr:M15 family metallopeptidase [Syntrophaceticus sp.]MDD4360801.1 M15 family metallopeptidase [Syntrophaceticus sp.]MDD4783984.1 M15 family metallopeptidase [Syntrophaceticus sp.]